MVKFAVADARILLAVELYVITRVKRTVKFARHANLLLNTAMENLDLLRIGGGYRKTGILEISGGETIEAIFCDRYLIIGLIEFYPFITVLGKSRKSRKQAKKCKNETFHPGFNHQHQLMRNIRKLIPDLIPGKPLK